MPEGMNGGDVASVVGGALAGGGILGFLRWAFTWTDRRALRRDKQLQAWEASLAAREKDYRAQIEHQLDETRQEVAALRTDLDEQRAVTRRLIDVMTDLSSELETHAPSSPALRRAKLLLKTLPFPRPAPELSALAERLDADRNRD